MARTAVVAGTATAVSGRVARRQQAKFSDQEQATQDQAAFESQSELADMQRQTGGAQEADLATQLQELANLKASGVLSDEEFAAAKAKLIG
jgi:succinate dehydrogenase/fumarate reductase flavoprotein subunit